MIRSPNGVRVFLAVLPLLLCACPPGTGPGDGGLPSDGGADGGAPDAGAGDGGTGGGDGGAGDGGALACDAALHDPVLGTARLGAGFQVLDWAPLPASYHLPMGARLESRPQGGLGLGVYGLMGDGRVHRLGGWPDLALPAEGNLAFDAVHPDDRALQVLPAWALPSTRGQVLVGYRTVQGRSFVGGAVARFDLLRPDAGVSWLPAPGVESLLGLGAYFLVGADQVGATDGGRGVYAVDITAPTAAPVLAATYPWLPGETVRPGLMAVTTDGLVVLGFALDLAARQSLRLPPPAALLEALSGGVPVALASAPELSPAEDIANVAGFGPGVALLHATQYQGILPTLGQLDFVPLTPLAGGVQVGTPARILEADDACTVLSQLVPAGDELLVGLWDRNGQRVLRLAPR